MIIAIISTIFSTLGIYGFFTGNLFLLYLGMASVIIEHAIGILSGSEKSLTTVWLALLVSFVGMSRGVYWLQAIAVCLCFEGTICFVFGLIMILFFSNYVSNTNSKDSITHEEIPTNFSNDILEIQSITNNIEKVSNIIEGKEIVKKELFINKPNPYTGKLIENYNDVILYLKMYKLDFDGQNPLEILKNNNME